MNARSTAHRSKFAAANTMYAMSSEIAAACTLGTAFVLSLDRARTPILSAILLIVLPYGPATVVSIACLHLERPSVTNRNKRRAWKIVLLIAALLGGLTWAGFQIQTASRVLDAYLYALPLFEIERVRYKAVYSPQNPARHAVNVLVHTRSLADHTARFITTPNSDTLYSLAILDLSGAPVRLDTPDTQGRYYSVALIDAYTNNAAIIGKRTTGTQAQSFLIAGPRWNGTVSDSNLKLIRSPTATALLLVRVLVDGPEDLSAASQLQDGFKLTGPGTPAGTVPPAPVEDDGTSFVEVVNQGLQENPPPADNAPELAQIAKVGLGPLASESPPLAAWNRYLPLAHALLKRAIAHPGRAVDGWIYTPEGLGDFGTRYKLRAGIALAGLLALPPQEATYTSSLRDNNDEPFDGARRYRLHLPPGGVPVDAFWSLSIYEVEKDGRLFFADNPIHRYAIGDRTSGLKKNADGSIDIYIQRDKPEEGDIGNWLPAPAGTFRLIARAYQPRKELLEGNFRYPPVVRQ